MTTASSVERVVADLVIGVSLPILRLRAMIVRIARADIPVLLHGPTGAGKEVVANALHVASGRTGPFVPFNVCAITDSMFEDALFGHVRGAFTGATCTTRGYLDEAHGGTLFLDEIGALNLGAQAKLLRALETKRFRQVGASLDRDSSFRLIAATNADLPTLVAEGVFRADLRYRLGAVVLEVPPLSARREDIPVLASYFLRLASRNEPRELSPEATQRLQRHDWPGNVRQLKHVIEVAALLCAGDRITGADVDGVTRDLDGGRRASFGATFFDRRMLAVLDEAGWRVAEAAQQLGVSPRSVYRRLSRLGIKSCDHVGSPRETRSQVTVCDVTNEH